MRVGRERGFTLVELLVVMVIAAVAMSVVVPMFTGRVSNSELKAATRDLASALRHTRAYAIANRQEAVLTLDVERRRYEVSGSAREFRLPEKLNLTLLTGQSELSGNGRGSIRYYPDGTSTGGRITVAAGERSYEVDVNWLTGQVAIRD